MTPRSSWSNPAPIGSCETCRFVDHYWREGQYHNSGWVQAVCRAHPVQPDTTDDNWCGEFQAAPVEDKE